LAKLESQLSPVARWPGLAVDPSLASDDPARAGQTLYVCGGASVGTLVI